MRRDQAAPSIKCHDCQIPLSITYAHTWAGFYYCDNCFDGMVENTISENSRETIVAANAQRKADRAMSTDARLEPAPPKLRWATEEDNGLEPFVLIRSDGTMKMHSEGPILLNRHSIKIPFGLDGRPAVIAEHLGLDALESACWKVHLQLAQRTVEEDITGDEICQAFREVLEKHL